MNKKGEVVSYGGNTDNLNNDPVEMFEFQNDGTIKDKAEADQVILKKRKGKGKGKGDDEEEEDDDQEQEEEFYLQIVQAGGKGKPKHVKFVLYGSANVEIERIGSAADDDEQTDEDRDEDEAHPFNLADASTSTLYGHANAEMAVAVGAIFYGKTPEFDDNEVDWVPESFSSYGPQPITMDEAGKRLKEPIVRNKPDIVAPDGPNTSFFIPGLDIEHDGHFNFMGTSAAAPSAAATALMMKQANPDITVEQIKTILVDTAIDMHDPLAEDPNKGVGFDWGTGAGLIDGWTAVQEAAKLAEEDDEDEGKQKGKRKPRGGKKKQDKKEDKDEDKKEDEDEKEEKEDDEKEEEKPEMATERRTRSR
mmetsp:Transcript_473/g.1021  ORF Transcript_473/g.1021 Transcript_473/m.1021 type:complete len:363 (+) Transcript_473:2-1090(+)